MEVHHPHHAAHTKKWTAYLLEFLMLFLAVFLGFIAENIREHSVEKARAKKLLQSFIVDLKKDTAQLNFLLNFREKTRKPWLDSLYSMLNTPPEQIEKSLFYELVGREGTYFTFSQSRGTIDQLRNAGYLRYFSDPQLLNRIADYDYAIYDNKGDEDVETGIHYDQLRFLLRRNIDNNDAYNYFVLNQVLTGKGIKPIKPDILENIKAVLIQAIQYNTSAMPKQLINVKAKALELLQYLQDTYKVK
jgi:hypothetical protein